MHDPDVVRVDLEDAAPAGDDGAGDEGPRRAPHRVPAHEPAHGDRDRRVRGGRGDRHARGSARGDRRRDRGRVRPSRTRRSSASTTTRSGSTARSRSTTSTRSSTSSCRSRTTTRSPASCFGQLGRAAEPGDEVTHDGIVFHVDSVDGQRIDRLTVTFGWSRRRRDGRRGPSATTTTRRASQLVTRSVGYRGEIVADFRRALDKVVPERVKVPADGDGGIARGSAGAQQAARHRRAAPAGDRQPERDRQAHRALADDGHDARQRPPGKGPRRRAAARRDRRGGAGRRRSSGSIPSAGAVVGIHFDHRHLRVAVADLSSTVLAERAEDLDVDHAADDRARRGAELVDVVLAEAGIERSRRRRRSASALSGPVDRDGTVGSTVILPGWAGLNAADELTRTARPARSRSTTTRTSARSPRSRSAPDGASPTSSTSWSRRASAPASCSTASSTAA